jgi:hypothetical protein
MYLAPQTPPLDSARESADLVGETGAPDIERPDATQALRAIILDLDGFLEEGERLLRRARARLQALGEDE